MHATTTLPYSSPTLRNSPPPSPATGFFNNDDTKGGRTKNNFSSIPRYLEVEVHSQMTSANVHPAIPNYSRPYQIVAVL